jgi:hypothetical protein
MEMARNNFYGESFLDYVAAGIILTSISIIFLLMPLLVITALLPFWLIGFIFSKLFE